MKWDNHLLSFGNHYQKYTQLESRKQSSSWTCIVGYYYVYKALFSHGRLCMFQHIYDLHAPTLHGLPACHLSTCQHTLCLKPTKQKLQIILLQVHNIGALLIQHVWDIDSMLFQPCVPAGNRNMSSLGYKYTCMYFVNIISNANIVWSKLYCLNHVLYIFVFDMVKLDFWMPPKCISINFNCLQLFLLSVTNCI